MSDDLNALLAPLTERSGGVCELCGSVDDLAVRAVLPIEADVTVQRSICACTTCSGRIDAESLDGKDWFCLQESVWSEVAAVQVVSWRLLRRMSDVTWAQELLEQVYLDESVEVWAKEGAADPDAVVTVDSNGTVLNDGDTVTIIKDLDVKGAGFTAKRGTVVKGIRLTGDPALIEGRVNRTGIFLKTCFLKRVS